MNKLKVIKKKFLNKNSVIEYIKYNIVGTSNFTVCQLIYMFLILKFDTNYILAYTICNFISSIISYIFNLKITFKESKYSVIDFFKVYMSHIVEYFLNIGIIFFLINFMSISKLIAPMISPILTTPIIFILVRKSIKKKAK